MFGRRISLFRYSKRFINLHHSRSLSNKNPQNPNYKRIINELKQLDGYHDLSKLDFMKAANIIFFSSFKNNNHNTKPRFNFHLGQFFFALMVPLAVFLVADYAQDEIRRKEKESELKKKEETTKQMEAYDNEPECDSELSKVKERQEALEETIKGIAVVSTKQSSDIKIKSADQIPEKVDPKIRSDVKSNQASLQPH